MADIEPVFETTDDQEKYWTDPTRSTLVGDYNSIDARIAYDYDRVDVFLRRGDIWSGYRVTAGQHARASARAFTRQRYFKELFRRSVA